MNTSSSPLSSSQRTTCRACDSGSLEVVLALAPSPVGDAYVSEEQLETAQEIYSLDLSLCQNCSLPQLTQVVSPEILYGNFLYTTSVSLGLVEHFRQYATDMIRLLGKTSGNLAVDIGSNDGTLLKFFQKQGMEVLGVEPASAIAQDATSRGIETLPALFTPEIADQIRRTHGPATLVTSNNTLANVDDLQGFVGSVRSLLRDDGLFVFETGYWSDIVDNLLFDTIYHEHLCYFSVRSLERLFERHGMQLIEVSNLTTKGGSIRGIVQLDTGTRPVSASVDHMLELEERKGMLRSASLTPFAERVNRVKSSVSEVIAELKSQGETIVGFGASVGVTTLLYYFDIGDNLDFLVDDNPVKQRLYSPGYHLPVHDSSRLLESRPGYVLILSWRYADPIIAKNQPYLDQGGHFIRFLPSLEVL